MIVFGHHIAEWVLESMGTCTPNMKGLGWEKDGQLVAGTAFEPFNANNMFGHQRIDKAPPKEYWFCVANYIFNQCKVKRLTATVEADNHRAIKLNKHIGFVIEATLKDAGRNGDLLIMTLWADNCKPLNWSK